MGLSENKELQQLLFRLVTDELKEIIGSVKNKDDLFEAIRELLIDCTLHLTLLVSSIPCFTISALNEDEKSIKDLAKYVLRKTFDNVNNVSVKAFDLTGIPEEEHEKIIKAKTTEEANKIIKDFANKKPSFVQREAVKWE